MDWRRRWLHFRTRFLLRYLMLILQPWSPRRRLPHAAVRRTTFWAAPVPCLPERALRKWRPRRERTNAHVNTASGSGSSPPLSAGPSTRCGTTSPRSTRAPWSMPTRRPRCARPWTACVISVEPMPVIELLPSSSCNTLTMPPPTRPTSVFARSNRPPRPSRGCWRPIQPPWRALKPSASSARAVLPWPPRRRSVTETSAPCPPHQTSGVAPRRQGANTC
mmetsp:Transcript_5527/g.18305  ORF Transcript_5527/g.18305 Transcript_5527/m.18305 type:complete len:220 (-) Transcript_5527:876-1535(-)